MATRRVDIEYRSSGAKKLESEALGVGDAFQKGFGKAEAAAQKASRNVALHLKLVDAASRETRHSIDQLAGRLGPLGSVVRVLGPAGIAAGAGLAAIGTGAALAIKRTAELEVQLSDLRAITGATGKDLEFFRQQAIALGAETRLGASQFAEAVKLIGSAKPELLETSAALVAVTKDAATLAKASRLDIPAAAKVLATTLNQFRLGAEESTRVINVLAAGAQKGAVELPQLVTAIEKAGTEARQAGVPLELFNATLQELGASGLPLEKIGTSVRNILLRLQTGARDTNPAVVGLTQALLNLRDANLSVEESTKLFGVENATVAALMLETAESSRRLAEETTGTATAFEQAAAQSDNLADEVKGLSAAWDGLLQTIGNTAPIRGFVRETTDALNIVRANIQRGGWSAVFEDLGAIVERDRRRAGIGIYRQQLRDPNAYAGQDPALRAAAVAEARRLKRLEAEARGIALPNAGGASRAFSPASSEDLERAASFGEAERRRVELLYEGVAEAASKAAKANREAEEKQTAFLQQQLAERIAAIDAWVAQDVSRTEQGERDKQALREEFERETEKAREKASKSSASRLKKDEAEYARHVAALARLEDQLIQGRQDAAKAGLDGEALIRARQAESLEDFTREVEAQQAHLTKLGIDGATLVAQRRVDLETEAEREITALRTAEQQKLAEQQLREAEKLAEQQQRLLYEPVRNAIESTQRSLVDMALATGQSWEDVGDRIIGVIKRIAVEWATARLFQTVLGELGGGTGTGLLGGFVGGGATTIPVTLSSGQTVSIPVGSSLPTSGGSSTGTLLSLGGTAGKFAFQQSGAGNYLSRLLGFGGSTAPVLASSSLSGLSSLPVAFGGLGSTAIGAGTVYAPVVAANGGAFLPGITQAAGSGVLAGGNVGLNAAGQVVPLTNTSAAGSAAAAGGSALGTAVAGVGAAIALALATKGLIDDRRSYERATLGADQGSLNRLTGIGASQIAIGTGIGAGVGTAIMPGIGTLIGAGLGAAVGAAVSQAITAATVQGIGDGFKDAQQQYRTGLTQGALDDSIKDKLSSDILLTILGGPFNLLATELFGGLVAPDVEKIVQKLFRGALGRTQLNTAGIPASGRTYGTGLGEEGLIAARLIGATQAASGTDDTGRLRGLRGILLGGVSRSATRRGEEAEQILAEVFTDAFDSVLARALRAIKRGPKRLREGDTAYTVEAFSRATGLSSLVPEIAANFQESGVPSSKAIRNSREAFTEAIGAAMQSAAEEDAFIRSMAGSFQQAFAEGASKALARSPLGEAFANLFSIDRESRKDLRRARRQGNVGAQLDIITADFLEDVDEFARLVTNPDVVNSIARLDDAMLQLNVSTALVTDGVAGAAAVITAELQPLIDTVQGYQQLGRDVRSRVGFAVAGPGFAGEVERIRDLTRAREDAARGLTGSGSPFGGLYGLDPSVLDRNLGRAGQFTEDVERALPLAAAYGEARLQELEAQLSLQRQLIDTLDQTKDAMRGVRDEVEGLLGRGDGGASALRAFTRARDAYRDFDIDRPDTIQKAAETLQSAVSAVGNRYQFLTGAEEGFGAFADQADVRRRGARALREQLTERQREIDRLLPTALRGGAGSDDAIARLSRLLPEAQQLGAQLLSPSAQRRQDAELRDAALALEAATKDEKDVAEKQLGELERIAISIEGDATTGLAGANSKLDALKGEAATFREQFTKLTFGLEVKAQEALVARHQELVDLLGDGPNGKLNLALRDVESAIQGLTENKRAAGGPVRAGGLYLVGERGPETFIPSQPGVIVPNGGRVRGGGTVVHITLQAPQIAVAPGTPPQQMTAYARSWVDGAMGQLHDRLDRLGVPMDQRRIA